RVVQPEDVDAALRRGRNETACEVASNRARPDEEPAAERKCERRRRSGLQRADPLPRALDASPDRVVEDAAAGHFEVRETRSVEELREPKEIRRGHQAGQRFLTQYPDRCVD